MKERELSQLYGVRTDVARGPMDEYRLPSSYAGVVEEHLLGRDCHDWSLGRFDEVQRFRFLRHHLGKRECIFRVGSAELLVCCPAYLVANVEYRNFGPDSFDNS